MSRARAPSATSSRGFRPTFDAEDGDAEGRGDLATQLDALSKAASGRRRGGKAASRTAETTTTPDDDGGETGAPVTSTVPQVLLD